jgi:predicted nucleic acid-binding protein
MDSQDLLKRFAAARSIYFDLPDGEEAKVKFIFAEEVPNHFDRGETSCIRYHLEIDGKEMLWDRTSRELAKQMALIPEGATVFIKRIGEKSKTKYFIRKVES